MKLTSDERVAIAQACWSEFEQRRGYEGEMSSAEFHLLSKWMSQGIPLPVLLRGIQETGGKPRMLHACANSVERVFGYWQSAAALTKPVEDEWGPERTAEERERIMAKFRRPA